MFALTGFLLRLCSAPKSKGLVLLRAEDGAGNIGNPQTVYPIGQGVLCSGVRRIAGACALRTSEPEAGAISSSPMRRAVLLPAKKSRRFHHRRRVTAAARRVAFRFDLRERHGGFLPAEQFTTR